MSIVCQYCLSMLRGLNCIAGRFIALHSILCCTGNALYPLCIIAFQCSASHCIRLCQHCVACKALYCIVSYESAQDPKKISHAGVFLPWFAKMILRDRCNTSYDLASLFRGRRSTFDRWTGKIAKRIGTRLSALHSTFHF